jgi:hypothetical protein
MKTATVQRTQVILHPDRSRVLLRPFLLPSDPRAVRICAQVMALPETEVHSLWQQVKMEFSERHAKTCDFLKARFEQVRPCLQTDENLSERQVLLGAYTHEYSPKPPRTNPSSCRIRPSGRCPAHGCSS